MQRWNRVWLGVVVGMLLCAVFAWADPIQFRPSTGNGANETVRPSNPLPVALHTVSGGVNPYPAWGSDVAHPCTPTTSTISSPLAAGNYAVTCGAQAWGDQGDSSVTATTSERRIPADMPYPLRVTGTGDTSVAFICTSSTTCWISKDT